MRCGGSATSLPRIPRFPGIPEFHRGVQPQPHEVWQLSHISSQNSQISRNSGIPQGCAQPHLFPIFKYFLEFRNSTGVGSATSLPRIPSHGRTTALLFFSCLCVQTPAIHTHETTAIILKPFIHNHSQLHYALPVYLTVP